MIPKLCESITDTNGLGRLSDVISCKVTQEINGAYELTMRYPVNGALYDKIENDLLIGTRTGDASGVQYFRIVRISRPINGAVTIYAQHYSYQLNYIHIPPCTLTGTVSSVLEQLTALSIEANPFTLTTDIDTTMTLVVDKLTSLRSVIGGMDYSILELLGAEVLWDNDTVTITSALVPTVSGQKNVALRYGKNLRELEVEDSIEGYYTGVLPFWSKEDTTILGSIQYAASAGSLSYERIYPLDLSSDYDEQPSVSTLDSAGAAYITENGVGILTPSIKATPAQLWRTAEGAKFADIETIKLGSTLDIIYNNLGVNVSEEVIETVYDAVKERYESMTLGAARANIASNVAKVEKVAGVSAADYPVEQGVSGTWTYRKWASGVSECWGYYDVSGVSCTTATGSLYVTSTITPGVAFPDGVFLSGTYPTVAMTFHSVNGTPAFIWCDASTLVSQGATPFRLMRQSSATISGRMEYVYKGRWK